jgi:hypothetical protein
LNLLEGYFSVHNFSNSEKIIFSLLKVIPHVRDWWDTYSNQNSIEKSAIFMVAPTWDSFKDSIKEQYYPVGSYKDAYTPSTMLHQERGKTILDFTNILHTLCTKLGIKDFEQHTVLTYRNCLHIYIQIEMSFLDITSLGVAYRYAIKIEKKIKKNR